MSDFLLGQPIMVAVIATHTHTRAKRTAKADADRQKGQALVVFEEVCKEPSALEALLENRREQCGESVQVARVPAFTFSEWAETRSKSTISDQTEGVLKLDHIGWLHQHTTARCQSKDVAEKRWQIAIANLATFPEHMRDFNGLAESTCNLPACAKGRLRIFG